MGGLQDFSVSLSPLLRIFRVWGLFWGVWGLGLDNYIVQAGFALARKFGLVSKGSSKHDPTLETVEKSLARKEKMEQNNRSV